MADQKQLFLFGQVLPGSDTALFERIQECANYRNRNGATPTKALEDIPADNIVQMVVGYNHVAFLLKDHTVARLSFEIVQNKVDPSTAIEKSSSALSNASVTSTSTAVPIEASSTDIPVPSTAAVPSQASGTTQAGAQASNAAASYAAAAATAAANRRVMMAARRPGGFCGRAGVIVDRARPLVPASSIPEELIAQAQVVLQGKSRDVIVRELQRTNLNVNEAVNNLLSRDDDEGDDLDETSEAYLHEELLSLLDAGLRTDGAGGIIDQDSIYTSADGYEYMVSRDLARRRDDAKSKDRTKENAEATTVLNDQLELCDSLQYWCGEDGQELPAGVKKFLKIASMNTELIALADDGRIYSWKWEKNCKPSNVPHSVNSKILEQSSETASINGQEERIIDIESCAWRAIVLTNFMRVGSFMDLSCGSKVCDAFLETLIDIPDGETVEKLYVCPLFSAIQTTNSSLYWRGIYPFNERRKLFEKAKTKNRKHVTFDTTEIVEGCEVRTKSSPIYSAGSVAVNFAGGVPMVGILQESAWTLNETCRFRVLSTDQYDNYIEEKPPTDRKVSFNLSVRKRAAPSDEGSSTAPSNVGSAPPPSLVKETAWSLKEVVFIKEETVNDTGIVKIKFDSSVTGEKDLSKLGLRLMRKDDLVVVPSSGRAPRSPDNFQRQLQLVHLPSNIKRIISMAIDNNGLRILVEKRNKVHLLRLSCLGKLFSDHAMPINLNTLISKPAGNMDGNPRLENYGDVCFRYPLQHTSVLNFQDSILLLRDGSNSLVPLLRNAVGGFREPSYIGIGRMHDLGIGLRYLNGSEIHNDIISSASPVISPKSKNPASKSINRIVLIATLVAPSPESTKPEIPSLMQNVLYCNVQAVKSILDQLHSLPDEQGDVKRAMIAEARVDGNRNIFHTAVINAFSTTNKEQADDESTGMDTTEADAARAKFDRKWHEMVNTPPASRTSKLTPSKEPDEKKSATILLSPNKERQLNAIEIIREMSTHPAIQPYFNELMKERDANGLTPFMCGVQMRAYKAASLLWNAIENSAESDKKSKKDSESLIEYVMPTGTRPDDSPLFVLCYNDTCSFTWTGDEHVNQDIFECRTCGLTGTLCCCTECAYTCHRNHDCKLKRTSPTAYCDCWEKCSCKALVKGNTNQREHLLSKMLDKTDLIKHMNARGEHLLLFLAKTVGRQIVEQENFVRRKLRTGHPSQPPANMPETVVPEHDLDPPKFARSAFSLVLKNWSAVKSLLQIGIKNAQEDAVIVEEVFHLGEQSGVSHLDKFAFTLLVKCQESQLDTLLNTFVEQANKQTDRDPEVDDLISRFVRSVVRLFTLIVMVSPAAASIAMSAVTSALTAYADPSSEKSLSTSATVGAASGSAAKTLPNYRAVAISGVLSLVRASLPPSISVRDGKEAGKKKSLNSFILKCRRVFQVLMSYSINELINCSDSILAPVRTGMVKPASFNSSNDVLETIERYLATEQDLSTMLVNNDLHEKVARKRASSHKETDDSLNPNRNTERMEGDESDNSSDNDSDNDEPPPSRRLNSQGSVGTADEVAPTTSEPNERVKRKVGQSSRRATTHRDRHERFTEGLDFGDSTDSLRHEMDDDEEDPYFMDGDDDGDGESADDAGSENAMMNGGDSNDTAPAGQDEVSVELMDANDNASISDANASSNAAENPSSEIFVPLATIVDTNDDGENLRAGNVPSRVSRPTDPAAGNASFALTWAVRRSQEGAGQSTLTNDNADSQTTEGRSDTRANVAADTSVSVAGTTSSTQPPTSRLRYKDGSTSSDEITLGGPNTAMQLAMCFSILIDELMLELVRYDAWTKALKGKELSTLLKLDKQLAQAFRRLFDERMEAVWSWLHLIMDRTEAKLKFGNALATSSIGPLIIAPELDNFAKKPDERRFKKKSEAVKKDDYSVPPAGSHRSELCTYFLSLLRSHSSENGEKIKEEVTEAQAPLQKDLRKFYKRSKSICYPFISTADNHHAFKYPASQCLPLSTSSHLLQPNAERNQLFALPVPHRTRNTHREVAYEHGIEYPTLQSLSRPPMQYDEVSSVLSKSKDSSPAGDKDYTPQRPDVIKYALGIGPKYQDNFDIDALLGDRTSVSRVALQRVLGRWSNTTLFLSKAFHEQITTFCGGDASLSVLLNETAGYHVRQSQFRQRMEKFKALQGKDLVFSQMSREKNVLLSQTIKQLNQQFIRRTANASSSTAPAPNSEAITNPPLASHKVTFREEPGEGTGVARSFYSAIAEALMNVQHLPNDLSPVVEDGTSLDDGNGGDPGSTGRRAPPSLSPTRNLFSRNMGKRTGGPPRQASEGVPNAEPESRIRTRSQRGATALPPVSSSRRVRNKNNDDGLKATDTVERTKSESAASDKPEKTKDIESQPLFYKSSKSGYYTPIPGSNSQPRLNAFRNVGRIIGICLQQMEILPLFLCRHVIKFILGRPITWFDLAFFDPSMFDSLRSIVYNDVEETGHSSTFYESLQLTFAVDISAEEGGGILELKPDGGNIPVTKENVLEYIYLFVEHRLLGNHVKCLEAIRRGVFDVVPQDSLNGLTSEDMRLILCGNQDINVSLLESYTKFSDESSAAPEVLAKYKTWFWSVVSKFTTIEKQDLIFFWTGSPSLPSTEEGFQPLPTIMIRPADDVHLPTANTCISRLYVPLYSSKKVLRSKLLLAIKARNFGFV
ncbi:HECT-domain (ubiquitin-transferase) domain-containing protein [Ditylenchus destructor]|nr:HECT-domain (ubiquitin-transferase) domain-containing protein [Ditylenchus destructor]